ncbi:hypothetical protein ACH5RR_008367 [Cinchona calisaya]|uniref:RNase H type-1 domain-containing protein n=1 Tax=Cinchona calisaya TaxID=153742 RepID=A0ABD3AET5_9GENT
MNAVNRVRFKRKIEGVFAPTIVEAQAANVAVELLLQLRLQKITIEGDAQQIINLILNPETDQSDINIPLNDAVALLQYFSSWKAS